MELITLKITPLTNFTTYPKGDTIFGQILNYLFLEGDNTFINYLNEEPKLIVSDMMPFGYVYKPALPKNCFTDNVDNLDNKKFKKSRFIKIEHLQNREWSRVENIKFYKTINTIKNSVNRETFSTDKDGFAPYSLNEIEIYSHLWMFILVESEIKDKILDTLTKISIFGFGSNSSIGKGKFSFKIVKSPNFNIETDIYMSLSPVILDDKNIISSSYEPFARFGRFGFGALSDNVFKRTVLMGDSGTVVKLKKKKEYFGKAIENGNSISKSYLQGYSIALPILSIKDEQCL